MVKNQNIDSPAHAWLSDEAKKYVELSAIERIAFIRSEHFVGHPQVIRALKAIQYVYTQVRKPRMECLAVIGKSGVGKTTIVKRFVEQCGLEFEQDSFRIRTGTGKAPVLLADLSGIENKTDLYRRIEEACAPSRKAAEFQVTADAVLRMVAERGTRLLILDESDRIAELPVADRRDVRAQLKRLTNSTQTALVLLGTRQLEDVINDEDTLRHRFVPDVHLNPLSTGDDLRPFVVNFAKRMPLRAAPAIDNVRCVTLVLRQTNGRQPEVARLIKAAAIHSIRSGAESLSYQSLVTAVEEPYVFDDPREVEHD